MIVDVAIECKQYCIFSIKQNGYCLFHCSLLKSIYVGINNLANYCRSGNFRVLNFRVKIFSWS